MPKEVKAHFSLSSLLYLGPNLVTRYESETGTSSSSNNHNKQQRIQQKKEQAKIVRNLRS